MGPDRCSVSTPSETNDASAYPGAASRADAVAVLVATPVTEFSTVARAEDFPKVSI
jgi:hypothetical protein